MRRRLLLLLLALCVVPAAVAQAGAPTVVVDGAPFEHVESEPCGFDITFTDFGTYKVTTFYDRDGNPLRSVVTNARRYQASATANGKTLVTNYPLVVVTSTVDGTRIELGLANAYHIPGGGMLMINAGRLVLDDATREVIRESGNHDVVEGDVDAFCDYFAA